MNVDAQTFAVKVGIVGPLVLQALAVICITVIIATRDGSATGAVIDALLALITVNGLGAGATAVAHVWRTAPSVPPAPAGGKDAHA